MNAYMYNICILYIKCYIISVYVLHGRIKNIFSLYLPTATEVHSIHLLPYCDSCWKRRSIRIVTMVMHSLYLIKRQTIVHVNWASHPANHPRSVWPRARIKWLPFERHYFSLATSPLSLSMSITIPSHRHSFIVVLSLTTIVLHSLKM